MLFLPIFAYCISSILMILANKMILSTFEFKLIFLLLSLQSMVALFVLFLFTTSASVEPLNSSKVIRWAPVTLSMIIMTYSGSKALSLFTVSLFTIFKSTGVIIIAFIERIFFDGSIVTNKMLFSFLLISLSSIVAGLEDLSQGKIFKDDHSDAFAAYSWMITNIFTTCAFSLILKTRIKELNFKEFDTVYYNKALALPFLLYLSYLTEGKEYATTLEKFHNSDLLFKLGASIALTGFTCFLITFTNGWCLRVVSSTTLSMVGSVNKIPLILFSLVIFNEVLSITGVFSLLLLFSGGLLYAHAKNERTTLNEIPLSDRSRTA